MSKSNPESRMLKERRVLLILLGGLAAIAGFSCSGEQTLDRAESASYLPESIDSLDLQRESEIATYRGDSLFEYINGGAELYHVYEFREVSTASYRMNGIELIVDLYQFDDTQGAYGLYSMLRADGMKTVSVGVQGFIGGGTLDFTKGKFLGRFTSFEDVSQIEDRMIQFGRVVAGKLPGDEDKPELFALFPSENSLEATDKIFAESYLGRAFLSYVYTRDFGLSGDTLTLILTLDPSGEKFLRWQQQLESPGDLPEYIAFDDELGIRTEDSYHGAIVAGLRGGKLLGAVGFDDESLKFVADWINATE
jgi:hypothetical protein